MSVINQQRRRKPPRDAQSVYPPRSVGVPLGGYRSTTMTDAVRCWCHLLEQATLVVAGQLSASEWNFLSRNVSGREDSFDPGFRTPGEMLAQMVERGRDFEVGLDLLAKTAREAKLAKAHPTHS